MKKAYCVKCNKYGKMKKPQISYFFDKKIGFSLICDSFGSSDGRMFKKEELIEILNVAGVNKNT